MKKRAIIIVIDSMGCGAMPDCADLVIQINATPLKMFVNLMTDWMFLLWKLWG